MQDKKLAGSTLVIAFFTALSRFFGLLRDVVLTHVFGASEATDAFFIAFTIPNMLRRLMAEGALTVAFVPVYTKIKEQKGFEAGRKFYQEILGWVILITILMTLIGILFASPLVYLFASGFLQDQSKFSITVHLLSGLFPYVLLVSVWALWAGIMNAHNYFAAPAAAPIFLNLGMIIAVFLFASHTAQPIFSLVIGVLLGGLLQLALQIPFLIKLRLFVRPIFFAHSPDVRYLAKIMFPALFGLAVYQINMIILRQLGSYLPHGQISYYYNADRLMQFSLGVFAVSIASAALPAMSEHLAKQDMSAFGKTFSFLIRFTNFLSFPAALGLMVLAYPIVSVIYFHGEYTFTDVTTTASALVAFAPSLVAISQTRIIIQAFYALTDLKTPVQIALITVVVNFFIGVVLVRYEVAGLAATLSISSFIQMICLFVMLCRRIHIEEISSLLLRLFFTAYLILYSHFPDVFC